MRNSFIFYRSFFESISCLNSEQKAKIFDAICHYALDEKIIELTGVEKAIFTLIVPQIDANNKKFKNGQLGAEHGKKGGRPKKEKTTPKPHKNPVGDSSENPIQTPNVNENANVNDIISSLRSEIKISDDLWVSFLEHRKKVKASLTLDAQKLVLEKLKIWQEKGHDAENIIKNSIENGWKGVFEPKQETKSKQIHNNFKDQDYYAGTEGFKVD